MNDNRRQQPDYLTSALNDFRAQGSKEAFRRLVGAAALAELERVAAENPDAAEREADIIVYLLNRNVTNEDDRAFLLAQGWDISQ